MPSTTRRGALSAVAGVLGMLGGCSALSDDPLPIETVWRTDFDDASSVGVTADGTLLAGSHSPFADRPAVSRLDEATGETQWSVTLSKGRRSPITVRGTRAYLSSMAGLVAAVDTTASEIQWRHELDGTAEQRDSVVAFPPLPSADRVVVPLSANSDHGTDRLVGLSRADGSRVFDHRLGATLAAAPGMTAEGVIAATLDGRLRRVAPDGGTAWERSVTPGSSAIAIADGTAYLVTAAERLLAIDTTTGATRWTAGLDNTGFARPLVVGGRLYVGGADYTLRAFETADGRALWRDDLANAVTHGPVAVGDRLVTLVGGECVTRGPSGTVPYRPVVLYVHDRDGRRVRSVRLDDDRVEWLTRAGETVYLGQTFGLARVAREAIVDD